MVHNEPSLISFVCLEETQTAVIDIKKFKAVLSQFFLVRMTFQINFLREIPLFWGWQESDLHILYQIYYRKKYSSDCPVYL